MSPSRPVCSAAYDPSLMELFSHAYGGFGLRACTTTWLDGRGVALWRGVASCLRIATNSPEENEDSISSFLPKR